MAPGSLCRRDGESCCHAGGLTHPRGRETGGQEGGGEETVTDQEASMSAASDRPSD